jgi:hypothetical protein
MRASVEVLERFLPMVADDPLGAIVAGQQATVAWVIANPVLAQLMYWRPVPGFEPSSHAFEPAVRQLEILRTACGCTVSTSPGPPGSRSRPVTTTGTSSLRSSVTWHAAGSAE